MTKDIHHIVAGILLKDNMFLVEKRKDDDKIDPRIVCFPRGHIKEGETIEEAIIRGMREELGIIIKEWKFVHCGTWTDSVGMKETRISYFMITKWEGEMKPKEAKRVFWESNHNVLDTKIDRTALKTIFLKKTVITVCGIIENEGRYLLLQRSKNNRSNIDKWQFPEGKPEFGETPLETLKREIKEETSLDLTDAKFLTWHSSVVFYPSLGTAHQLRLLFRCKALGEVNVSEEHNNFGWFKLNDIEKLDLVKSMSFRDIKKILDGKLI